MTDQQAGESPAAQGNQVDIWSVIANA